MPIQIPNDLPAAGILKQENIFVMPEKRASSLASPLVLVSALGLDFCFLKEIFLFENRDSMSLASQAVQG